MRDCEQTQQKAAPGNVIVSATDAAQDIETTISDRLTREGLEIASREDAAAMAVQIIDASETASFAACAAARLTVLTGASADAVQASWRQIRAGASDVVFWEGEETADHIAARLRRWSQTERLAETVLKATGAVGASPVWRKTVARLCETVRHGSAPLLILGPTGAGKEVAARAAIAAADCPADRVSIVDCGATARDLIASELFGHERGAFTGAHAVRAGAVAEADGGVLFLDEIGELPLDVQPFFLRLLQEGAYRRLGGDRWRTSDFRLIAATNRDLAAEVAEGRFREDLYHRIAAITVTLPRLADRPEDILPLAEHFLCCEEGVVMDAAVRDHLIARDYPGNVRELRQICHRLAASRCGGRVSIGDLVRALPDCAERPAPTHNLETAIAAAVDRGVSLTDIKTQAADAAIRHALALSGGSTQIAADRLGVTPRALQLRARQAS